MFKKYYCIKQHVISDCGAACLATISKQHGYKTSISKIRYKVADTDKQVIIADPGAGIVKLTPEEFFGEVRKNESTPPKYQLTGVLVLITPTASFQKGDNTKGIFHRFFSFIAISKKVIN